MSARVCRVCGPDRACLECSFITPERRKESGMAEECWTVTFCPECGPDVSIDEDGCCIGCGATAVGRAIEALIECPGGVDAFADLSPSPYSPEVLRARDRGPDTAEKRTEAVVEFRCTRCHALVAGAGEMVTSALQAHAMACRESGR